jgi:dephospho-CoA kinase
MYVPTSVLADPAAEPFAPNDLVRAIVTADDGLYEAIVTAHGGTVLHDAGIWRLARHSHWTHRTVAPARALRQLLESLSHPLVEAAIQALDHGITKAQRVAPTDV